MLIMSIVLAAAAPMMTTRMRSANDTSGPNASPWHYAENGVDAYFGSSVTQKAMIGQNQLKASDNGRLIVNISDDVPNHVIFNKKGNYLGRLGLNDNNSLFMGDVAIPSSAENVVAIGMNGTAANNSVSIGGNATTSAGNTVAIGNDTSASGANAISIGDYIEATAPGSIAIGSGLSDFIVGSTANNTIAIGRGAQANAVSAIAIGTGVVSSGEKAVAIGWSPSNSNRTGDHSVAIGPGAEALAHHSVAVGSDAITSGKQGWDDRGQVAIGSNSITTGFSDIAIGLSSNASSSSSIAIGYMSLASAANSVALGHYAQALAENSVAIGYKAQVNALNPNTIVLGCETRTTGTLACTAPKVIVNGDLQLMGNLLDKNGDDVEFGGDKMSWPSDSRLKNIGLENKAGLEQIKQLKVVNYTYKKDDQKVPHVGVIAQDLQKVFPAAVEKGRDGFLKVRMEDMFFAVVNAVKELDQKVSDLMQLKQEVKQLKTENAELKARLDKLEAKMK